MGQTGLRQPGTWTTYRPGPSYSSTATASARAIPGFGIFSNGLEQAAPHSLRCCAPSTLAAWLGVHRRRR
jgi:hypothetical protein